MNVIGHFKTITKHRHEVRKLCFKIGLYWQGMTHDLSKYSFPEFIDGCRYYQGDRSPNDIQRRTEGYSSAWMHHKGRNKHHFEFWYDYEMASKKIVPMPMPDRYIKEMFCDRVAASKTYGGASYTQSSPLQYLTQSTASQKMTEDTYRKLLFLLNMLAKKGEKETLAFMRKTKVLPTSAAATEQSAVQPVEQPKQTEPASSQEQV